MWNRVRYGLQRFAMGRYGSDKLNMALLGLGVVLALVGTFTRAFLCLYLAYVPILLALFRSFSRNVERRQREGVWFDALLRRLRDRKNRYFVCPRCGQMVRVPKGKGKISIRCPRCGERFLKTT